MRKLFFGVKNIFARLKQAVGFFFWKTRKTKHKDRPVVLFDVEGLILSRRLTQVVLQFDHIGYSCLVRARSSMYLKNRGDPYEVLFWELTNRWKREKPVLVVCGKENPHYPDKKRLVFDDDIQSFPLRVEEPFYFPLHLHIKRMVERQTEWIPQMPKEMRIGAVFIGSTAPASYLPFEKYIHETFHLPTRLEVLDDIRNHFPDDVFEPEQAEDLWKKLDDPSLPLKNKIVLVDKIHIGGKDYLQILRNSIFHIWTCGDAFPYCHNQPEGMLCGAIPVFWEYPLYAGLENQKNCLCFRSFDELNGILAKIVSLQFPEEDLWEMSAQVEALYQKIFSDDTFQKNVQAFLASEKAEETYYVHPDVYPRNVQRRVAP